MRRSIAARVVLALSIAAPALAVAAQDTRTLSGVVRDTAGRPIADAIVAVVDTNQAAFHARTDAHGRFSLTYRAVDTGLFAVSRLGFLRFWRRLDSLTTGRDGGDVEIRLTKLSGEFAGFGQPKRPLDIRDDTVPDAELEDVARAADLPLLRERARGGGDREIRLAIGGGIFVPEDLLVLRSHGGRITGEVWFWWGPISSKREPDFIKRVPEHAAELGCPDAHPRRAQHFSEANSEEFVVFVCRARFEREPDWAEAWRRLDSLGVWTLPDEQELPRFTMALDGFVLTAEMFDGKQYRLIHHANPDPAASDEAARAAHIARVTTSVTNRPIAKGKR